MTKGDSTLCIDIGGTGTKLMVVAGSGKSLTERLRVETPQPATPPAVLGALKGLMAQVKVPYARVSVGFPGVVVDNVVKTAPNLHPSFTEFPLGREVSKLAGGKPTRVLNDAGVQGHAVITGKGTELCITLGTGFGFALYVNGNYVPNLEMAHHPFKDGYTYEEYVGNAALEDVGKKKWNKRVRRVVAQLQPIFNCRTLYIGGGNSKHLAFELPDNTKRVENTAGLLGGARLWQHEH